MKKVLLYEDAAGEFVVWDISTPKLYEDGYLALFKLLDNQLKPMPMMGEQLRDMAERGNATYAKVYLELHRGDIPGKFAEVQTLPFIVEQPRKLVKVVCPEALEDPLAELPVEVEPPPTKEERKTEGRRVALP